MFFLLFPVGEEWFSRFMRIPSSIFWCCKIDEILMSFYTWFSVWFCLFGFLQKFATFCASVCEARLRICVKLTLKCERIKGTFKYWVDWRKKSQTAETTPKNGLVFLCKHEVWSRAAFEPTYTGCPAQSTQRHALLTTSSNLKYFSAIQQFQTKVVGIF